MDECDTIVLVNIWLNKGIINYYIYVSYNSADRNQDTEKTRVKAHQSTLNVWAKDNRGRYTG